MDKVCDGEDLLGTGIRDLWLMIAESKTFQERVYRAEEYLLPFAIEALACNTVMNTAQHMINQKGAIRVDRLAYHSGLSVRNYERRFADDLGVGPKLFARITRFGIALDQKRTKPDRLWASIAHELCYFDQMHMVRDFRSLGGDAPGGVLQQSGDIQPWSIASPMTLHHLTESSKSARFRK
jgi:transcriptional regulator GlxA family with amidase domain